MKSKSFKIVLIIGVWLILLGGLFYGAAYALGERPESSDLFIVEAAQHSEEIGESEYE